MQSLYNYIVKPLKERYDNIRFVDGKELLINTSIENHRFVSKQAEIVAIPKAYDLPIKVGDKCYVHFNVFRRWYNMRGEEKNSSTYFKDDLYFVHPEQIYMYNNKAFLDYKRNINGFDIKFGSNYTLMSAIPDYGATIEVSSKF